jgi:hypothetical protein
MAIKRKKRIFAKKRSTLNGGQVFTVLAIIALVVFAVVGYYWTRPGHYAIADAKPVHRERKLTDHGAQAQGWDIIFNATWDGHQPPTGEAKTCTYEFTGEDGSVLQQGSFGLYVGDGEIGATLPEPVPDRLFASDPVSARVSC